MANLLMGPVALWIGDHQNAAEHDSGAWVTVPSRKVTVQRLRPREDQNVPGRRTPHGLGLNIDIGDEPASGSSPPAGGRG